MNKTREEAITWRLLAATPPALIAADLNSGIALGLIFFAVIAALSSIDRVANKLAPALRQTLLLISAATLAAAGDLCLQAFAWTVLNTVRPWLPLIALIGVLQITYLQSPADLHEKQGTLTLRLMGTALLLPMVVGGLRELSGFLFFLLPAALLVVFALLIAANNRRQPDDNDTPTESRKARRVRVTGPVS